MLTSLSPGVATTNAGATLPVVALPQGDTPPAAYHAQTEPRTGGDSSCVITATTDGAI